MRESNVFNMASRMTDVENNKRTYDTAFKKFFRRKRVLAAIILNIIPDFDGIGKHVI